ncbi:MAG: family 10 glycosylhydrolase [Candidatus Omnitrophica bacterium]|nr:family 10 glycosylhydrolase [Candidatus Omnitrophota bacterium]
MNKASIFKSGRLFLVVALFFILAVKCGNSQTPPCEPKIKSRGVWVTCFSEHRVLYSTAAIDRLLDTCARLDINEIYIQIYRAGQAYYDSKITDNTRYQDMFKSSGTDTIEYLLKESAKRKIKVFAWANILSLSQNKDADIVKKHGESVLTRDQYSRVSIRTESRDDSDKYYLRDNQIFLEPGDSRVVDFTVSILEEIITRYPGLNGIHLDYIRYPYPVPYSPSSKFMNYGLIYGYGENSVKSFKEKTGLDPFALAGTKDGFFLWDNWRRDQVTNLVRKISKHLKAKSPGLLVSAAAIPAPFTAYSASFQDWPLWLEEGIVDDVILMNYTKDLGQVKNITKSALSHRGKGKVLAGVGVFLMKDQPHLFAQQLSLLESLSPDGIVFFTYDDLSRM